MEKHIAVLCADDHPVVREGLRAVLSAEEDIEVVATAGDGEVAVQLFRQYQPDVTVLDLRMPAMDGLQTVRAILGESPQARIVMLTTYEGDEDIYRALQAGATTYLLKDLLAEELVRVIREVHAGGRPIPQAVGSRLAGRVGQPALTQRETQVLTAASRGGRNKEIGVQLGISEATVVVHMKNILSKLKVHDRTEAVTVALRRGILHLD